MNTFNLYIKIRISYSLCNNQKVCIENWDLLDSCQIFKTENQELMNAEIKDAKYVKII